jgi:hypothetical protein
MGVGAWVSSEAPIFPEMHHQPKRLVRAALRSPAGPSADRLTTLEGLGNLGSTSDEPLWEDEDTPDPQNNTDWAKLVVNLVNAASPIAVEAVKGAFATSMASKGMSQSEILQLITLAQQRADAVKAGTASMPTAGWIGIGVGAVAVLGLIFFMLSRR